MQVYEPEQRESPQVSRYAPLLFGGIIGTVSSLITVLILSNINSTRIDAQDKRIDRIEASFEKHLDRVERKLDRLIEKHLGERKGVTDG